MAKNVEKLEKDVKKKSSSTKEKNTLKKESQTKKKVDSKKKEVKKVEDKTTKNNDTKKKEVKKEINEKESFKTKEVKVVDVLEKKELTDEEKLIEATERKNRLSKLLGVGCVLLFALVLIISIIETNEKSKFFNKISYKEAVNLIKDDEVNIIYWASPNCGFCSQFSPIIKKVSYEYQLDFNYLNTTTLNDDQYAAMYTYLAEFDEAYNSSNLGTPSLILVKDNKVLHIQEGALSESELIDYLIKHELIEVETLETNDDNEAKDEDKEA